MTGVGRRPGCLSLALAAAALLPSVGHAQTLDPQEALRARWRVSLEVAAHASIVDTQRVNGADLDARGFASGSVGASVWRAVHPAVDLGARVGLRLPDTRLVSMPISSLCTGDQRPVVYPNDASVFGIAPHATLAVRARPGGPSLPLHLLGGVAASVWVPTSTTTMQWQCDGAATSRSREVGGAVFGLSGVFGIGSHFGPSEEYSIGIEYWHHLGVPDGAQYSLGLTFGWELNRGAALPASHQGRGRVPSIVVGVVGAALWLGGFLTLSALSSIG